MDTTHGLTSKARRCELGHEATHGQRLIGDVTCADLCAIPAFDELYITRIAERYPNARRSGERAGCKEEANRNRGAGGILAMSAGVTAHRRLLDERAGRGARHPIAKPGELIQRL